MNSDHALYAEKQWGFQLFNTSAHLIQNGGLGDDTSLKHLDNLGKFMNLSPPKLRIKLPNYFTPPVKMALSTSDSGSTVWSESVFTLLWGRISHH